MQEQAMGQTGAITAQSAAKVGQLLGVELMVMGSVNEFGQKESSVGGGLGGHMGGGLLGGSLHHVGVNTKTARVGLDIRLVNTNTGEIVAAEGAEGEESKQGVDISTNEFDFSDDTHFDETLAGKATAKAITKAVDLVTSSMSKVPWTGKILKVNPDRTVLIKPGEAGGVKAGDAFVVYSKGEDVIDPDTGLSMGAEETKAGAIEVTEVKDQYAKAKVTSGTGFKAGDSVREK